jgi:hypothetical protein
MLITAGGDLRILAGRTLRTNLQLAIRAFTDRLGGEIRTVGQGQVNDPSFVRAHRLKRKRHAGLSHSIRGRFAIACSSASRVARKPIHVANQPRAALKTSSKHLIDQVLQRFKQFAGLRLQQLGVVAFDVQHFAGNTPASPQRAIGDPHVEDVLEKLCCLLRNLSHFNLSLTGCRGVSFFFSCRWAFAGGAGTLVVIGLVQRLIRNCCVNPTILPTSQYKTKPDGALHKT